jgi:uncharacterized protein
MKKQYFLILILAVLFGALPSCKKGTVYKTLIITGQGEHNWKTSSVAVKQILDETGLFSSAILTTPPEGEDMSGFSPDFSKYKLVVVDYDGEKWPEKTTAALVDFVNNGGGVVFYDSKSDPVSGTPDSVTVSKRHSFEIRMRVSDHPVTKGLPVRWLHPDDEIIQGIKVAGEDSQILATAFSDTAFSGTGRSEPVLVARNLGKGRIFATLIGAPDDDESPALHCAGFIVILQRGAEWAASGNVTQEVPSDFPTAAGIVLRNDFKAVTLDDAFQRIGSYNISKSTKYYTCIQSSIRKAAGDEKSLLSIEKKMVKVLKDPDATAESKKLMLRELSWMGTEYCIPAIKELAALPELKDAADFALTRIGK